MLLDGISLAETDGNVFLRCQPVAGRALVDVPALHALLQASGLDGCLLMDDAITQAAHDCNTVETPFVVQVAARVDATVQVHISADDMHVDVCFTPPQGGKPISLDDAHNALKAAGVVFGVDEAALALACANGASVPVCVASGVPLQNGQDTAFQVLLPQTADRAPQLDANGLIDYREHSGIVVVRPGEALMRRTPPTLGAAGYTVRGQELLPRAGKDEPFVVDLPGTKLDDTDPNLLEAALLGQPVLVNQGMIVEPVLRVAAVNMETGNIRFDGTVHVEGDVLQGMRVVASGDIIVQGTVDGGLLEAGGDVCIAAGCIAQAQVQAGGAVSARFAENCRIQAGTVIALDDMALECELVSLNQILIGIKAPQRARLMGGTTSAMMLLRVPMLGSSKGGVTRVQVGVNPELELQVQALNLRLEKEKNAEENLQKLIKQLTAVGDPKGMLDRVRASWRQALQVWSLSLAERTELERQQALALQARVEVGVGVDGAVDLSFGNKIARLRSEMSDGVFSIDPAIGLVFTDAFGRVMQLA